MFDIAIPCLGNWMQFSKPIDLRTLQNMGQISDFKGKGPPYNGHLPGLASILHPQVSSSLKIAPIGRKQGIGNVTLSCLCFCELEDRNNY